MSKTIRPLSSRQVNRNKLYRTPRTPSPIELREKEKSFILDNIAVSSISDDYSRANPKHGNVIPPYNAYFDNSTRNYFGAMPEKRNKKNSNKTVRKTMEKTFVRRVYRGIEECRDEDNHIVFKPVYEYEPLTFCSISGHNMDKYHGSYIKTINGKEFEFDSPKRYLHYRNRSGAGYSNELIDGHRPFVERVTPIIGYNGPFGFRRNNYKFIQHPSSFGVLTRLPIHSDPEAEQERREKADEFRKRQDKLFGRESSTTRDSRKSSSKSQRSQRSQKE